MNDTTKKVSYPYVPEKYWWALRKRFAASLPKTVTADYLSVIDASARTAEKLVRDLRILGLIDELGVPTSLANEWRHDDGYRAACVEILNSVYPDELKDAVPPSAPDKSQTERWFSRKLGSGEAVSRQFAATYLLICNADPTGSTRSTSEQTAATSKPVGSKAKAPKQTTPESTGPKVPLPHGGISVTLNLQLTLPESTNPAVYEAFFSSMRKHLIDVG